MAGYYPYGTAASNYMQRRISGQAPRQTQQQLAAWQNYFTQNAPNAPKPVTSLPPVPNASTPQQIAEAQQRLRDATAARSSGGGDYDQHLREENLARENLNYLVQMQNPQRWYENNVLPRIQRQDEAYKSYQANRAYFDYLQAQQPVTAQMMNAIHADPYTSQMYQWNQLPQLSYGTLRPGMGGSWQPAAAGDETAWMQNPAYAPRGW